MPGRLRFQPVRLVRVRLRQVLRRLDRQTPDWMRWLTPWGTSLVLHALLVLAFAILLVGGRADSVPPTVEADFRQLRDDLTTIMDADIAGDPFTTLEADEPPSMAIEISPLNITSTPELPPNLSLSQNLDIVGLSGPPADLGSRMGGFESTQPVMVAPSSPFSGRTGPARAQLVRREGGTVESEAAVERGLDWLARHQRPDGAWSLDTNSECVEKSCPHRPSMQSDTAATGLALLPMLGGGADHVTPGRYQHVVERGLKWLQDNQKPNGDLFLGGAGNAHLYSHAIATMALCEAYGITRDEALHSPAQLAIDFIVAAQNVQDGGWRYHPGQRGDTSVMGWQIFALRSGFMAGLDVPDHAVMGCRAYLDAAATDAIGSTYAYQPGGRASPVMTAESLVARQLLGWPKRAPALLQGAQLVTTDMLKLNERNIYYWYYGTQLLHNLKGPAWATWNPTVREGLIRLQVRGKGCDRGSWDSQQPLPDRWGNAAGRLYTTSLSILTLEVYYRYLPLYRTNEAAPITPDGGDAPLARDEQGG